MTDHTDQIRALCGGCSAGNPGLFDDVRDVVLETTGDISVLHGSGPLHDELLTAVRLPSDLAQPHADR